MVLFLFIDYVEALTIINLGLLFCVNITYENILKFELLFHIKYPYVGHSY